jgi:hypothetical protein
MLVLEIAVQQCTKLRHTVIRAMDGTVTLFRYIPAFSFRQILCTIFLIIKNTAFG